MEPTILDNENYVLNRWFYRIATPKRNDIIVYESDDIYYMTRIIGLPGENIEMKNGKIYIDEILLAKQRAYSEESNISQIVLKNEEYMTIVDNLEATWNGS